MNANRQHGIPVVQPPQDSAAILALTAKLDGLQKKLADDQAKAEKAAAEAAARAEQAAIEAAVRQVFRENRLALAAISGVSSIDLKQDEPGLLAACRANGWQARFYSAAQLRAVPGSFTGSNFVASVTGVDNVCERAALYGGGRLLVQKQALGGVTVAVAEEPWEVRFG